jgi:tetratricopeptide (TPR) repeat protein
MARRRFRRKDLKRPDEFVSRGRQVLEWSASNSRMLTWSIAGVAAVAVVVAGIGSVHSARIRQANEDLAHALVDFRAERYAQAATQLADVATRWQPTDAGRLAALYAANANLNADNIESATLLLQDVLKARPGPLYIQQEALLDLGFALERKGDAAAAASRYSEAAALDGPYKATALFGEARCREQAGERDRARELYEQFAREFPEAPEKDIVAAKVAQLKG